jgi:hypothetical protein
MDSSGRAPEHDTRRTQAILASGGGSAVAASAGPSEPELVARVRAGDEAALEILLDRYQDRVTRVVLGVLHDPMDAEEVTQDVFVTVIA